MSSRAAAITILALAIASTALAAEKPKETEAAPVDLTSLFETPSIIKVMPDGMMVATPPTHLVMLARRGADGKPVVQCFGTALAAETFLRKTEVAAPRKLQDK